MVFYITDALTIIILLIVAKKYYDRLSMRSGDSIWNLGLRFFYVVYRNLFDFSSFVDSESENDIVVRMSSVRINRSDRVRRVR